MKTTDYKAIRYTVFLLIIVVFSSNNVIGQYDKEKGYEYYKKGLEKFNKEEYKEADSLLKITLKYFPSCDAYYYLAKIRKCSNDKVEYCKYLDSSLIYGNKNVYILYKKECVNRDTSGNYSYMLDDSDLDKEMQDSNYVYLITEVMPEFPGGEQALREYIDKNIKYPDLAKQNKIEGKVFVYFVINKEGNVEQIEVKRKVNLLLDAEAVRVIKDMPKWKPGMQCGKPVKVAFTVPINFALN